jgi:hypothetical protein
MSVASPPRTDSAPYRLTVRQFERTIDAEVFPPGARVELLDGIEVEITTKDDPRNGAVSLLAEDLRRLLPAGWVAREEKPIQAGRWSRPEPDLVIARGPIRRYFTHAPRVAEIAAVIEVSDAAYAKDRHQEWPLYAAARLAPCWMVNIPGRRVEVYTDTTGPGDKGRYEDQTTYGDAHDVPVVNEGIEVGRIAVEDLLP